MSLSTMNFAMVKTTETKKWCCWGFRPTLVTNAPELTHVPLAMRHASPRSESLSSNHGGHIASPKMSKPGTMMIVHMANSSRNVANVRSNSNHKTQRVSFRLNCPNDFWIGCMCIRPRLSLAKRGEWGTRVLGCFPLSNGKPWKFGGRQKCEPSFPRWASGTLAKRSRNLVSTHVLCTCAPRTL